MVWGSAADLRLHGASGSSLLCTGSTTTADAHRYNLFASNVILTSISYVYFPHDRWPGLVINLFTLFGSVVGQLLFGFLADWFGRTRLYGIELVLVIVSTIGVATSSYGYGDMSFLALFTWVRRVPCPYCYTYWLMLSQVAFRDGSR